MPRIVRVPGLKEPLTFPTGTPDYEIYAAVADVLFPVEELPPPPKPEAGFLGGFKEGITSLFGAPEAVSYLASPTAETRGELAKSAESPYAFQRFEDVESVGQGLQLAKEVAGQSVGFMAPPLAAAAAAGFASGPLAPIVAPATFLGVAGLQYLTETTARQAQEQEKKAAKGEATEAPDVTKVIASSAAQAGVDLIPFTTIFKPVGRLFGLAGRESAEKVAKETVETFEKEGFEAAAKKLSGLNPKQSMALGFGTGAVVEGVQEPLQTLLERWGAGLDLSSDDALKEYMEAAILGPILGGPFGAISTGIGNVQRGMSNKEFLDRLQAEAQGKPISQDQLAKDWDRQKAEILKSAQPISLVDEEGKPKQVTPELLESLGVSPNAKALSVGTTTVPMETVLQKDMSDKSVQTVLAGMFQRRMGQLSQEFKQSGRLMSQEEREAKVAEYTQAAQSFKSILNIASPESAINSPTNLVVQPSPADPDKFVLFNPVTNQIFKGKDGKERQYGSIQTAERTLNKLIGKEVSEISKKVTAAAEPAKTEEQRKADLKAAREKALAETPDPFAPRPAGTTVAPSATPAPTPTPEPTPAPTPTEAKIPSPGIKEFYTPESDAEKFADLEELSFRPKAEPTPTPAPIPEPTVTSKPTVTPKPTLSAAYKAVRDLKNKLDELGKRFVELDSQANAYVTGDKRGRVVTPRRDSKRWNEWQKTSKEAQETLEEFMRVEEEFKKASTAYLNDPVNQEEIARVQERMKTPEPISAPVVDVTEKIDQKQEAEDEAAIAEGDVRRAEESLTQEDIKNLQEALALANQAAREGEGRTFFPEDVKEANDFIAGANDIFAGLEKGTLSYAENNVKNLLTSAKNLKAAFTQRIADREKFEADLKAKGPSEGFKLEERADLKAVPGGKAAEGEPKPKKERKARVKKVQTPAGTVHTIEPIKEAKNPIESMANQIAALDGADGADGEFNDIAEAVRSMKDETKASKTLDLALRLKNAYDTAQGTRPGVSEGDRNAAVAQIGKIYDELDALQRDPIPVTPEGVKAAMDKNGNAKEAQDIANQSRKDICE
jgi:hypothetical protein